jgi:hypothetical protein
MQLTKVELITNPTSRNLWSGNLNYRCFYLTGNSQWNFENGDNWYRYILVCNFLISHEPSD